MKIFDSKYYENANKLFQKQVTIFANDLYNDFGDVSSKSSPLSHNFISTFKKIKASQNYNTFGAKSFHWYNWLDKLFYLAELIIEANLASNDNNEDAYSLLEEEIFDFWNESEFSFYFSEAYAKSQSIFDETTNLLPLLESHVLGYFFLHINKGDISFPDFSLSYQASQELGDCEKCLYVTDENLIADISKCSSNYPFLSIHDIDYQENIIAIQDNGKLHQIPLIANQFIFKVEDKTLHFLGASLSSEDAISNFQRIQKSLDIIKRISPDLIGVFSEFTNTIIPFDSEGVVSYSSRELPGYSMINFVQRDRMDTMDDLLHENGHHYLNTLLEVEDLIIEDDEMIYYSPWRENYRPIRGLYHACFTFFWALKLYNDLNMNFEKASTEKWISKSKTLERFLEEYIMLDFSYTDIQGAFEAKKISQKGKELIEAIYSEVFKFKDNQESSLLLCEKQYKPTRDKMLNLQKKLDSIQVLQ